MLYQDEEPYDARADAGYPGRQESGSRGRVKRGIERGPRPVSIPREEETESERQKEPRKSGLETETKYEEPQYKLLSVLGKQLSVLGERIPDERTDPEGFLALRLKLVLVDLGDPPSVDLAKLVLNKLRTMGGSVMSSDEFRHKPDRKILNHLKKIREKINTDCITNYPEIYARVEAEVEAEKLLKAQSSKDR